MKKKNRLFAVSMEEPADALAPYRERASRALALMAVLFLLPVAVNNVSHGRLLLGGAMLLGALILISNAIALYFRQRPPLPYALLLLSTVSASVPAIAVQGLSGALWSFPAALLFHFLLPPRAANACGIAQLLAVTVLLERYRDIDHAFRFAVPMVLLLLLLNLVLRLIGDLQQRLAEQTIRDTLTGAYNRRYMKRCLDSAIERNSRSGAPATLLLIDIDRFRILNDIHGHDTGDEMLCLIATVIRKRARKLDLLFRTGGQEFLLLLPDTDERAAVRLAEDLRVAVAHACLMQGHSVTVSIGVSELRNDEGCDAWLKHAGNALYIAKETGRDRIVRRAGLYLLRSGRA
jgi:diguanylate cyclase (GGDEF)-like protein